MRESEGRRIVPIGSASWSSMRLAEGTDTRTKPTAAGQGPGGKGGRKENGGKENSRLSVVGSEAMEGQAGRGIDESGLVLLPCCCFSVPSIMASGVQFERCDESERGLAQRRGGAEVEGRRKRRTQEYEGRGMLGFEASSFRTTGRSKAAPAR